MFILSFEYHNNNNNTVHGHTKVNIINNSSNNKLNPAYVTNSNPLVKLIASITLYTPTYQNVGGAMSYPMRPRRLYGGRDYNR